MRTARKSVDIGCPSLVAMRCLWCDACAMRCPLVACGFPGWYPALGSRVLVGADSSEREWAQVKKAEAKAKEGFEHMKKVAQTDDSEVPLRADPPSFLDPCITDPEP